MKNEILLSVIIPCFNMKHCIEECVNSIIMQNVDNIEIIIIDDGSTDGSRDLLQKMDKKNNRIVSILLEQNGGVSNARNIGFKKAKGKYIHCVDADDIVPINAYKKVIEMLNKTTQHVDIILGNYYIKTNKIISSVNYIKDIPLARALENNNLSLWSKWYSREFIIKNALYLDTTMKTAEDAMFCFKALKCNPKIAMIDTKIYQYNYDDNNNDKERHNHRDRHISSINNSLKVLQESFVDDFSAYNDKELDFWSIAYANYIGFIFICLWNNMTDNKQKEQAFYQIQETLNYINSKNIDFNLNCDLNAIRFLDIAKCNYNAFQSFKYNEYMMLLSIYNITRATSKISYGDYSNEITLFLQCCENGQVGMRVILKAIKNWLKFKIKRGKKDEVFLIK